MRLITTLTVTALCLLLLSGCSKNDTTNPPLLARETNIFGWPVASETCKPSEMALQTAGETTTYTYNIYGLIGIIAKNNGVSTGTDKFTYDASNKLTTIADAAGGTWRFIYNSNRGKAISAFYHAYTFNSSSVADTFHVTYPQAGRLVISVRHPFADSMFRDTLLLSTDYNPISFKRTRQSNGNDSTSTFIMKVDYVYGSALNPFTAEASVWNWIQPLYTDMRLFLSDPTLSGSRFTYYSPRIIPLGKYLPLSYIKTDLGPGVFNGTFDNVLGNGKSYPASFLFTTTGVSDSYIFQYNCQ